MHQDTLHSLNNTLNDLIVVARDVRVDGNEALASGDHIAIITHYDQLRKVNAQIKEAREALSEIEDSFSREHVPEALRQQRVKTITIEGIGRVTVSHRFSCTIITPDKTVGHDWLKSNGHGSLVTETVNSSTLAAFAKNLLEVDGKELPADTFKVGTSPYTSITKVK
jgi:hypothetical protein